MRLRVRVVLCLLQSTLLVLGPIVSAEESRDSGNQVSSDSSTTQVSLAARSSTNGPLSDYVPCMFSDEEQGGMRAREPFQRPLDRASAERLLDATNVALAKPLSGYRQAQGFLGAFQQEFQRLKPEELEGKTPDQANTHIQRALVSAVQNAANAKSFVSDIDLHQQRVQAADDLYSAVENAVDQKLKALNAAQTKKGPVNIQDLISAGKEAIISNTNKSLSVTFLKEVAKSYSEHATEYLEGSAVRYPQYLAKIAAQASLDAESKPKESSNFDTSKAIAELISAVGASAEIAAKKTEAKKYQPPEDVSCSMAVMSWKETRDIFGRRVANTFVAIQVNLRNLNNKNEFLVHDIQVAIDTGVTQDDLGRFQAGRDKLLVRAVAQRGQSDDRRNRVLHSLQAVGDIAGASSLVAGTEEFKNAVAIFQGSFITGFSNIFPDHTVEQLNHINDLVFSASNTSKVVVPVQGSVPLVTFISERPIEQLPFAWCGHPPQGHLNPARFVGWGPFQNCEFNGGTNNPGYLPDYRYQKNGRLDVRPNKALRPEELRPWNDLQYRDWRGAALRMLQAHAFVVVGGIHIQEVISQPKLANLDCATLTGGQVDISKTTDGMVSCSVTGTGLGLVSAVSLEKGDSKIGGKIKAANDGNSGTLQFKPDDLYNLEGLYSLHMTYKSDAQKDPTDLDSGESLSLAKQPIVTTAEIAKNAAAPAPPAGGPASYTLTLKGKGLDQLNDVYVALDSPNGETKIKGEALSPTATSATITFKKLDGATKYFITYSSKIQQDKQSDSGSSVTTSK